MKIRKSRVLARSCSTQVVVSSLVMLSCATAWGHSPQALAPLGPLAASVLVGTVGDGLVDAAIALPHASVAASGPRAFDTAARSDAHGKSARDGARGVDDCNTNGVPDDQDISEGTSQDCNLNTVPDECDIDLGLSDDTNTNGIPDECECLGGPAGFVQLCEAATPDVPGAPGDGVFIEVFNGIGGGGPPRPGDIAARTPDGTTLSPVVDFPHPGATVTIGQNFSSFFADTTIPPDEVAALAAGNFILRTTALLRITSDLDLNPATPEIDIRLGAGSDDGFHLTVGTTFFGERGDGGFGYTWFNAVFEDEGLYPMVFLFSANAAGFSGLELSWETARNGVEIIPQADMYLSDVTCEQKIEFEEHPAGTVITDQYRDLGMLFNVFSGGLQITDAFPTEFVPVSGDRVFADPTDTPLDEGMVELSFVLPGTDTPAGTTFFSCFVIDAEATGANITAYDAFDNVIFSEPFNAGGASQELVEISAPFISRIEITLGQDVDTSAIDNICFDVPAILDCNNNDIADDIDITEGTSEDCNLNGVPDECDVTDGTSEDCNSNIVPDECDVLGSRLFNAALGQPVTGSPYYNAGCESFPYGNVTDGDLDDTGVGCDWSFWLTPNGQLGSFTVDLGRPHLIHSFELQNTHNRGFHDRSGNEFRIFVSDNDVDYGTAVVDDSMTNAQGTPPGPIPFDVFDVTPVTGRYVKFELDSYFGGSGGLNEIRVMADAGSFDCNENSIPDECDIDAGTSADCDSNVTPDECELGDPPTHNCCDTGHGGGCNDATIESCVCAADAFCCSGEWDSDCVDAVETEACGTCAILGDCNGNGELDACDVLTGTSDDCNANLVPDDCDLAAGTSVDCNLNDIPDECDIADLTSADCDGNGIPDECEVSDTALIRLSQETAPGAGDFDDNILGIVEPFPTTLTAAGYYRYSQGDASSFNGTEPILTAERSHLFLVDATDGLSLFVVHDRPNNSDGGATNMRYELSGDPDGMFRSAEDDPAEGYTGNPGDNLFTANLAWSACCTDGVSFTGLDGVWTLLTEITSAVSGINSWAYYSPTGAPVDLALVPGQRVRLDVVFDPSTADCNGNSSPDRCDILNATSIDCNGNGTPDECEIPPIGEGPDCNNDEIPDDCQLTDNDCDANSVPDDCDVAGGEQDCNGNVVPDACEIAAGTGHDCNANDVLDECDITAGTSDDCNANGSPDECELRSEGNALQFDGDDMVRNVTPSALPVGNEPRTIEAWVRTDVDTGTYQSFISYGTPLANAQFFSLEWGADFNDRRLVLLGWNNDVYGTRPLNYGAWYHVAATFDGSVARTYVNGVLDGERSLAFNTVLNADGLRIGSAQPNDGWHDYLNGAVDEVRIWNVARSQQELMDYMSTPLLGNEAGLVSYWTFDEADGQIARDMSPSGNHCTLGADITPADDDPSRVASGATIGSGDCNNNASLDECDLIDGSSTDCNGNGDPDECDVDANVNGALWSQGAGGNGHRYEVVATPEGIDWYSADAAATAAGGYLATITSGAENNFVYDLVDDNSSLWFRDNANNGIGPWLGGYQVRDATEPGGGWNWITGEPFVYAIWGTLEPSNFGGAENTLHFFGFQTLMSPSWNDVSDAADVRGYVIEFDPKSLDCNNNGIPDACDIGGSGALPFFDDFESGPSPLWDNGRGNWTAQNGVYFAQAPGNLPPTYTLLPFEMRDYAIDVDINNTQDGGLWLRADATNTGVMLITKSGGLYWHIVDNGNAGPILNQVTGLYAQGSNIHLRVEVIGDEYMAYVNGAGSPATTLTTNSHAAGQTGLYTFTSQTFDNVRVVPDFNGDGVIDQQDESFAGSSDCNNNDVPDECDLAETVALRYEPVDFSEHQGGNLQAVDGAYPSGDVNLGGVPFSIPPPPTNIWDSNGVSGDNPRSIDISVNRVGVREVHTIINTFWGQPGPASHAWLEFFGSDGAYFRKDLVGNEDIRDYNQFVWTNNINGTTTTNVVSLGGHRLDKQAIELPADFADETLMTIRVSDNGGSNFQRIFLAGVTVGVGGSPDCNDNGVLDECEVAAPIDQWAGQVISFSSQFSSGSWSAAQTLGASNTTGYGDFASSWAPLPQNGALEFLTLGYDQSVFADGVTIRETWGNGMVYQVDVLDEADTLHTMWTGVDPSQPGTPVDYRVDWPRTSFLVKGVKIYTDTDHDPNTWEEIDSVQLHGHASTTDNDCNANGRPDDCDLTEGISEDCNNNDTPDECDATSGSSEDCNNNLVPDECEPSATLADLDFNSGVDSLGSAQGDLVFNGECGFRVTFTDDGSNGASGGDADGVHINDIGYGNIKAGSGDLVLGAFNTFDGDNNLHSSGIVARFSRGVDLVRLDDADDDATLKTLFAFDEGGNLIGQTAPGSQITFQIDTSLTGGAPIYSIEFDSEAGTAGGSNDGIVFTIDNFHVEGGPESPQRVLVINVHGTNYDADGFNLFQTVQLAGAEATHVDLSTDGDAAALINQFTYEQIWIFDLSAGADNYPTDWQAIADWFNADPSRAIICDGRIISSYWSGRWQGEGQRLSENYYENMRTRGGGLMLGTDDNSYHPGINSINSLIGLDPFVGNFSLSRIPVDAGNPLMNTPNDMGPDLFDDSSPGQTPYGLQPNGRILYTIAWHSGNQDTPGISATIQGDVGFRVDITSPANGSTFAQGETITFTAAPTSGDPPFTYAWTSSIDDALGEGETLEISTLSAGVHAITVLAEDGQSRDDDDSITVTVVSVPDLEVTEIITPCAGTEGADYEVTWTVTNNGTGIATGSWTDEIRLSDDAVIGSDRILASFERTEDLGVGESYTLTETVVLPPPEDRSASDTTVLGEHWIVVATDRDNNVDEGVSESNNETIDDVSFRINTPDVVSLCSWSDVDYQSGGAGNWVVAADGLSVRQSINGNPTFFVSDFDLGGSQFVGTIRVESGAGDDDYIGFVFGFKGLGGTGAGEGFYIFSWKKGNQSGAEAGFKVMKIIGTSPDFWDAEPAAGQIVELARQAGSNTDGWQHGVEYEFFLTYQVNGNIRVIIRRTDTGAELWNSGLINDPEPLGSGRVGFYNYSQCCVVYAGFTQVDLQSPVAAPGGPYDFDADTATITLDATASFDPDGAAGNFDGDITTVQWDIGDDGTSDDLDRTNATEIVDLADAVAKGLAIGTDVPVGLEVTDIDGLSGIDVTSIRYQSSAPSADAGGPYGPIGPGEILQLAGLADDTDLGLGIGEALTVEWDFAPAIAAGEIGDGFASQPDAAVSYETLQPLVSQHGQTIYLNVTDAAGLVASSSTTILLRMADLVVESVATETSAAFGEEVSVRWTVRNIGDGDALSSWSDRVYFSVDDTFDAGDTLLSTEPAPAPPLAFGGAYQQAADVTIPLELSFPEGDYFIFVVADGTKQQLESDEANNVSDPRVISLGLPDMPDLEVVDIEGPTAGINGDQIEIRWRVTNTGQGAAEGPWNDDILLSSDDQIGGDRVLATFTFPGTLDPGQSYERIESIALQGSAGEYRFGVRTDAQGQVVEIGGEDNNALIDDQVITIDEIPIPDLVVTSITPPASGILSGLTTEIAYVVTNVGTASTSAPQWRDQIFVSPNPNLEFGGPGGDQQICNELGTRYYATNPSYLEPGGSYNQSLEIVLPADVAGQFYIYVIADRPGCHHIAGVVPEADNINNISRSDAFDIILGPQPDLQVTDMSFLATAFSGQDFTVNWTDTNSGNALTDSGSWTDSVYLSLNADASVDGDILLGQRTRSGAPLGEDEFDDTLSLDRQLAPQLSGQYYVKIITDAGNRISEAGFENNNLAVSDGQVNVVLSPAPDILPLTITAVTSGIPGHRIDAGYSVENFGADPTNSASWKDNVYLSADDTLDPDSDLLIGSSTQSTQFAGPGLLEIPAYRGSISSTLPTSLAAGDYFVIVWVDAENTLFEFTADDNNVLVSDPFAVELTPTDLVIAIRDSVPASGAPGEPIDVAWEVTNVGDAETPVLSWNDGVYLSTDDQWQPSDRLLGAATRAGFLEPGGSYQTGTSISVPNVSGGAYYMLFVVDHRNNVYEQPPGEGNNVAATPFEVTEVIEEFVADLTLSNISAPSTANDGEAVRVSWVVTNSAQAATRATTWDDRVFLSLDGTVGPDDIPLGVFRRNGALNPSQSYTGSGLYTMPIGLAGTRRIIVDVDTNDVVFESGENNNTSSTSITVEIVGDPPPVAANLIVTTASAPDTITAGQNMLLSWTVANVGEAPTPVSAWRDSVYLSSDVRLDSNDLLLGSVDHDAPLANQQSREMNEAFFLPHATSGTFFIIVVTDSNNRVDEGGRDHDNQLAVGTATEFEPAPAANLVASNIILQADGTAGQSTRISWTVANTGEGHTNVSTWRDGVYLSRDIFLNTASDAFLGDFNRSGVLRSGDQYIATVDFNIPMGLSGNYFAFVVADRSGRVFEDGLTDDNIDVSPGTIDILLPPISDLEVTAVDADGSPKLGEMWSFSWEMTNIGGQPISGVWSDSVFLSDDQVWDIDDVFVGRFKHPSVTLAPGESTPGTGQAVIPAVNPGEYYVIVRSDVFNQIPESDESNNVGASAGILDTSIPKLTLGVPYTEALPHGSEFYAELTVPAGETVRISLDHTSPTAWTQLYIRKGAVPTIGQFDIISQEPNQPDQLVTIPTTEDATYYILARATSGTFEPDGIDATLLAEAVPFSVTSVWPPSIGTTPRVKILLEGSRFREGTTVSLIGAGRALVDAMLVEVVDGETMRAGFDTTAAPLGLYTVVVTDPFGSQAVLIDAVTIEPARPFITSTEITGPDNIRIGSAGSFQVRVRNFSNTDVPHAMILFSLRAHGSHRITSGSAATSLSIAGEDVDVSELGTTFIQDDRIWYPLLISGIGPASATDFFFTVEVGRDSPSGPLGISAAIIPYPKVEWFVRFLLAQEKIRLALLSQDLNTLPPNVLPVAENLLMIAPFEDAWVSAMLASFQQQNLFDPFYDELPPAPDNRRAAEGFTAGAVPSLSAVLAQIAATLPNGQEVTLASETLDGIGTHLLDGVSTIDDLWPPPCALCGCCGDPDAPGRSGRGQHLILAIGARGGSSDGGHDSNGLNPTDPNEKAGPEGYGDSAFVGVGEPLEYEVFFENIAEAGANAAVVTVTDLIDPNLRLGRFRVGNIQFGDHIVEVPPNRMIFQTTVDLTETQGVLVDITAGVNAATNEAFWILRSLDPTTGEIPSDPFVGFLPPNDDTGRGQGSVKYTIETVPQVATGTVIRNAAVIVFDTQPAIETNVVSNTVDTDPPSSAVSKLKETVPGPTIPLTWSGQDTGGGSGLGGFAIYVSKDGEDYIPLVTETLSQSADFVAQPGHTYSFYSIATDNAQNDEEPPPEPDAVTTVTDALGVTNFRVNGDLTQRSNIASIETSFTGESNLQSLIDQGAIVDVASLWKRGTGGADDTPMALDVSRYTWDQQARSLTIDLTTDGPGGSNLTMLDDANFELRLITDAITSGSGAALVDGDGTPDGLYRFGNDASDSLFRLAGDGTGDRIVNFLDLQLVRNSWLTTASDEGYDPNADMNSDGVVNFLDLQMVRNNWLTWLRF